jgi:hypothetical protein
MLAVGHPPGAVSRCARKLGNGGVRVTAGHFELYVTVELLEADVAADFGPCRSEEPAERLDARPDCRDEHESPYALVGGEQAL